MTDTTAPTTVEGPLEEPAAEPAAAPPPAPPGLVRRLAFALGAVAVVAIAVTILVWGGKRAEVVQPTGTGDLVVVAQFPLDDGEALRQTEVGADLRPGFDGRLTINGIAIPEDQMDGVIVPGAPETGDAPPEQLRPNNRNHVYFSPGPGKVIEKLPQGTTVVTVTYFRDLQPGKDAGSSSWSFDVA